MSKLIATCIFLTLIACESNTTNFNDSEDLNIIDDASSRSITDDMMTVGDTNPDFGVGDQAFIDQEMDAYDGAHTEQDLSVSDQYVEALDQDIDIDYDVQLRPDMLIRYEDDPVLTVYAPERLTLPANQTLSYQLPVHFIHLSQPIQAWSFSLIAQPHDQCRFTEINAMNTLAASVQADPPGIVDQGFTDMRVISTSDGAVALSVIIFSLQQDIVLDPERIDQAIAQATLEVNAPVDGQQITCTIQQARNIPIENQFIDQVVVWEGQSLPLFFRSVQIEVEVE